MNKYEIIVLHPYLAMQTESRGDQQKKNHDFANRPCRKILWKLKKHELSANTCRLLYTNFIRFCSTMISNYRKILKKFQK